MGQMLYADAIHIREQAKIDAARITTKSGNERRGAESALQNFSASLANQRAMRAAGEAHNDIVANFAKRAESASVGSMKMQLAAAEEIGANMATAAAAGTGGGSVELYNDAVRLTTAMKEEGFDRATGYDEYAAGQQAGNTLVASVAGLDNNIYRANLDYTQYVDHKKPSVFERIVGLAGTVAATVYGGPQAGMAVMGAFEARQAARNGDFAGASNNLMGALQNGIGAARTMQVTKGGPSAPSSGIVQDNSQRDAIIRDMIPTIRTGANPFNNWTHSSALGSVIIH